MNLHGVIPAVLTPFDAVGEVLEPALFTYCEWLIDHGVHGLFVCGTNGEGPAMRTDQRQRVAETAVAAARGRVPVIVMTGAMSTEETIHLTRHAQAVGAAAAAVVAPWYFAHDEAALAAHFGAVAEAVPDLDLFLYNIPANARNEITPALAANLARRYPCIRGVKDSSKSLATFRAFTTALTQHTLLVGSDALFRAALSSGGAGVVSAVALCFPEVMVDLYEACRNGDEERARVLQEQADQLRNALKAGPPIHPYKLAVTWRGLSFGGMRPPLRPCTEAEAAQIFARVAALGVLP